MIWRTAFNTGKPTDLVPGGGDHQRQDLEGLRGIGVQQTVGCDGLGNEPPPQPEPDAAEARWYPYRRDYAHW